MNNATINYKELYQEERRKRIQAAGQAEFFKKYQVEFQEKCGVELLKIVNKYDKSINKILDALNINGELRGEAMKLWPLKVNKSQE